MNKDKICAVILTGGLSTRMGGGNKTLKKFNNKFIFDRVFEKISSQSKKILINNNDNESAFKNYNTTIIQDEIKGFIGPLAGIHASFKWMTDNNKYEWLITIPGDTPFIPNNLVNSLLQKAKFDEKKIVIAKSYGKKHPIIGIWHLSLYNDLELKIKEGVRKILYWASQHPLGFLEFKNSKYDPFFNINYEEDIAKAEKIESDNF